MIPTEEEKQKIQEAQLANPDVPLGSAEQFLLTLSSISELSARLQLWAFKMDYEATEKVYTDPMRHLEMKQWEEGKSFGPSSRTCVWKASVLSLLWVLVPTTSAAHQHSYVIASLQTHTLSSAARRLAQTKNASERRSSKTTSWQFYGFPQDALVVRLSIKGPVPAARPAERHSRPDAAGWFGCGRFNGHTGQAHRRRQSPAARWAQTTAWCDGGDL